MINELRHSRYLTVVDVKSGYWMHGGVGFQELTFDNLQCPLGKIQVARQASFWLVQSAQSAQSTKCEFLGHTLMPFQGMKIVDRKVGAIKQMNAPKHKKGFQSFQGMVNHLKCSSVQLMKLSKPLKPLQEEDVEWT